MDRLFEYVDYEAIRDGDVARNLSNSGSHLVSAYFRVSACTEVLFRDDRFKDCDVTNKLRQARDDNRFFNISNYIFPFVGLINNILSMIVLFQPKYNQRLLPLLMRCFYIFSFCVALQIASFQVVKLSHAINSSDFSHATLRVQTFLANMLMKSADGLLAAMTVVRFVYCKDPFNLSCAETYMKKATLCIMLLVTCCAAVDFNFLLFPIQRSLVEGGHIKAAIYLTFLLINISFSIAAVLYEKRRIGRLSTATQYSILASVIGRRLSNYLCLSSLCFLVTTFPVTIFLLLPHDPKQPLDCQVCVDHWSTGFVLINLATWNVYFDNWVYCLLSKDYRTDLANALTRIFCSTATSRRLLSRTGSNVLTTTYNYN